MALDLRFKPAVGTGLGIYASDLEVAGIRYRKADAVAFAKEKGQQLSLEREPRNPEDPNAIKVIGHSHGFLTHRRHIGYVPRDLAAALVDAGLAGDATARLRNIWLSDEGFVVVRFDLVGPAAAKQKFAASFTREDEPTPATKAKRPLLVRLGCLIVLVFLLLLCAAFAANLLVGGPRPAPTPTNASR